MRVSPVLFISALSAGLAAGGPNYILNQNADVVAWLAFLGEKVGLSGAVLSWCVSFALAAILQWLIVWAYQSWMRGEGHAFLPIGIVFSVMSAISASGMALVIGDSVGLMSRKVDTAAAPILAQANTIVAAAIALDQAAKLLSAEADRTSRIEQADGGTCQNEQREGPGAITNMRNVQAAQLAVVSGSATSMGTAVSDAVRDFKTGTPSAEAVAALSAAIAQALNSQDSANATQILDSLILDYGPLGWVYDHGTVDTEDDTTQTCDDPAFAAKLAGLKTMWSDLVTLSVETGGRADKVAPGDGYSNVIEVIHAMLRGEPTDAAGQSAVITAFVFELVQVMIIISADLVARRRGLLPTWSQAAWVKRSGRDPRLVNLETRVADTLSSRILHIGRQRLLVMSEKPQPDENIAIRYLALTPASRAHVGVPREVLAQDWAWFEPRSKVFGSTGAFTLMTLPRGFDAWLRMVSARAHAEPRPTSGRWRRIWAGFGTRAQ